MQSYDGEPLTDGQNHNRQLCEIPLDAVRRFAHCASAVMAEARVDHLDSRVMLSAAKNTLIDAETKRLTLIDFDIASLYGFPRTDQLVNRYDQNLTFVQTWDGVPLSQKYPISEFNKGFCDLSRAV